ncbi:MAG: hypothetical protein IAC13_05765 [Firmicutes bacterium]|uniref:DUF340 domain-containing protein n=1 Tax=Candidatus Scybalomonas excrementavium TaxID=2840943 RepID=A0A9D9I0P6_9FIRM|nr:hypothetical protein [Candidatus Scybalomonas excrementavium]
MEKTITLEQILEWTLVLLITGTIILVGNLIGYQHHIIDSIPGMLILVGISIIGMILAKVIPINMPAMCYISIIGILLALPMSPTSNFVVEATSKVELMAICTPVLAYTGISIGKSWAEFKKIGWRGVVVTLLVMFGTFFTSALFAEILIQITK